MFRCDHAGDNQFPALRLRELMMAKRREQEQPAGRPVDPAGNVDPVVVEYPAGVIPNPLSEVLASYGVPANSLWVIVLRSHDGAYEGETMLMPNDDRTAGLISGGFVDVVPPPIIGVETYR